MKTLKALGALLTYPEKELVAAWPEIYEVLKGEKWLSDKNMKALENLAAWLTMNDLLDLQEEYVDLFDRTPSLSLHLFEHVHGDSRERGQAMVDLSELYKEKGFEISGEEMPDYLPLFLEYLSTQPWEEVKGHLGSVVNILAAIGGRLEKRKSIYACIFKALEETAQKKPDMQEVQKALEAASGMPMGQDEMDAAWEEQFAFDNNSTEPNSCPKVADMVARLKEAQMDDSAEVQTDKLRETGS